jgi:hypothetical protein
MFVEQRTYTLRPGTTATYLEAYAAADGLSIQERFAPCLGWYTIEAGRLYRLVTLWRWESFEERLVLRQEMARDPDWKALMSIVAPLVTDIESMLLSPAPFWSGTVSSSALAPLSEEKS